VPDWKTGFYYIADGAKVPIVPVAFDFERKIIRIHAPFWTTGDAASDIGHLKDLYRGVKGKHPENFALSYG
jgi:1-acyl-sn-glycerol-3-phosphate acyltransferase